MRLSPDLEGKSKRQVRRLLNIEVERMRAAMNLMTDELKVRIRQDKAADARLHSQALLAH